MRSLNELIPHRPNRTPARRLVLLLSLDWKRPKDPAIPLHLASLAASVRKAGYADVKTRSFPINSDEYQIERVVAWIMQSAGQCSSVDLGVGAYIWNQTETRRVIESARAAGFRGRVIVGGPQISYARAPLDHWLPLADVLVRGFGEDALVELTKSDETTEMAGIRRPDGIDDGEWAEVDLASLPSPILTGDAGLASGQRFLRWESQRGCPYRCSFCQHCAPRRSVCHQAYPLERMLEEIAVIQRHRVVELAVIDPVFTASGNADRIMEEFSHLDFRGRLSLQARFEMTSSAFLDTCTNLDVVLEFGLQTIHPLEQRPIGRRDNLDVVENVIQDLHRRQVSFEVSVIYGLPNQTLHSFSETVGYLLRRRVPVIRAFPLMLLPGTALDLGRDRWGLQESSDPIPIVVSGDSFDSGDYHRMEKLAAALRATEKRHPATISALQRAAASLGTA